MNIKTTAFELAQKLGEMDTLKEAILFGSAARDEMHKKVILTSYLSLTLKMTPNWGKKEIKYIK